MDFYNNLNQALEYIEQHLDTDIDYAEIAQVAGINLTTLQRLFPLLSNMTLTEYLRKRRLTLAGRDLAQGNIRVIDVAMDYGYTSEVAFSRAFAKFHGLKPSAVKGSSARLKYCPKLHFEPLKLDADFDYEIVELPAMTLYGVGTKTDESCIGNDAPRLFDEMAEKFPELSCPDYGMVVYNDSRLSSDDYEYWVLWRERSAQLTPRRIPAMRWLKFRTLSQNSKDIQETSRIFYYKFLPTCEYQLRPEPELEYYHDGVTDLLVPIY